MFGLFRYLGTISHAPAYLLVNLTNEDYKYFKLYRDATDTASFLDSRYSCSDRELHPLVGTRKGRRAQHDGGIHGLEKPLGQLHEGLDHHQRGTAATCSGRVHPRGDYPARTPAGCRQRPKTTVGRLTSETLGRCLWLIRRRSNERRQRRARG
jgi:hypothetical protein